MTSFIVPQNKAKQKKYPKTKNNKVSLLKPKSSFPVLHIFSHLSIPTLFLNAKTIPSLWIVSLIIFCFHRLPFLALLSRLSVYVPLKKFSFISLSVLSFFKLKFPPFFLFTNSLFLSVSQMLFSILLYFQNDIFGFNILIFSLFLVFLSLIFVFFSLPMSIYFFINANLRF